MLIDEMLPLAELGRPSIRESHVAGVVSAYARKADAVLREMLGRWVSELEPEAVFYQLEPLRCAGLTAVGHEVLYVRPCKVLLAEQDAVGNQR